MAGEPFASLAYDPPALARRSDVFDDSRIAHTIVNPGFFADAYLATIGMAAQPAFSLDDGDSRNVPSRTRTSRKSLSRP